jgi:hypothetical protein
VEVKMEKSHRRDYVFSRVGWILLVLVVIVSIILGMVLQSHLQPQTIIVESYNVVNIRDTLPITEGEYSAMLQTVSRSSDGTGEHTTSAIGNLFEKLTEPGSMIAHATCEIYGRDQREFIAAVQVDPGTRADRLGHITIWVDETEDLMASFNAGDVVVINGVIYFTLFANPEFTCQINLE